MYVRIYLFIYIIFFNYKRNLFECIVKLLYKYKILIHCSFLFFFFVSFTIKAYLNVIKLLIQL